MLFGLGVTVEFRSVIAGVNQVFNRARKVAALLEVHRELSRNLRRTLAVVTEQLFACRLVQHHSSLVDQVAVEKVLIERVREAIARRQTERMLTCATQKLIRERRLGMICV